MRTTNTSVDAAVLETKPYKNIQVQISCFVYQRLSYSIQLTFQILSIIYISCVIPYNTKTISAFKTDGLNITYTVIFLRQILTLDCLFVF